MAQATQTRIRLVRGDEEQLLAEHGLRAERVIAWMRFVLHALRGLSFLFIALRGDAIETPGPVRAIGLVLYGVFAFSVPFVLRRVTPDPVQARRRPYLLITADFAFLALMSFTSQTFDRHLQGELTAVSCAAVLGFSALRLRTGHVVYSVVAAVVTYVAVAVREAALGQPINPLVLTFVLGSFVTFAWLVIYLSREVSDMFFKVRMRENLRRFLPEPVLRRIESRLGALDPVKREVTVMFTDIRDFTTMSESMDPSAVLALLDDYFGRMAGVVKARQGIVSKYLGDGMLCVWGVPEEDSGHAEHAVQAALDMRTAVEEFNRERAQRQEPPLRIGIGVHTGPVAAGELGGKGEGLHEYTVIGDSVNLASRIEGLTKQHQVDLLVSHTTWALLVDRFEGRRCGEDKVKGRTEPVVVYAVAGRTVASGSALG